MTTTEDAIYCRICLKTKGDTLQSIYVHVEQTYLPLIIERICDVRIADCDEPDAHICHGCTVGLLQAHEIIQKCQHSQQILMSQRAQAAPPLPPHQLKSETFITPDSSDIPIKQEQVQDYPSLDALDGQSVYHMTMTTTPQFYVDSVLEKSLNQTKIENEVSEENSIQHSPAIYECSKKVHTKPRKRIKRSREQYINRKIRSYPVKQPLMLIGDGVERQRRPRAFHHVIPDFYFRCQVCYEFESNVATYAVAHLRTVHNVKRPAIFRCSLCDAQPFVKNQSLQEHIRTKHQNLPKSRNFTCDICGQTFLKNSHMIKHKISKHKTEEVVEGEVRRRSSRKEKK